MKTFISTLIIIFIPILLSAQEEVQMADTMRSEGKIYVVVAIILTIFLGLIAYLIRLDRKVSNLEKQIKG